MSNNLYLNSAEYTFQFITTNGQASADTDTKRDTARDQTRFQQVSTQYNQLWTSQKRFIENSSLFPEHVKCIQIICFYFIHFSTKQIFFSVFEFAFLKPVFKCFKHLLWTLWRLCRVTSQQVLSVWKDKKLLKSNTNSLNALINTSNHFCNPFNCWATDIS